MNYNRSAGAVNYKKCQPVQKKTDNALKHQKIKAYSRNYVFDFIILLY